MTTRYEKAPRPKLVVDRAIVTEAANLDQGVITQDGVARAFAGRHAGHLRYCHHAGAWFEWRNTHWQRDETDIAFNYVRTLGREVTEQAKPGELREVRKVGFAGGVERFCRADPVFAVTSESWDRDPWLLGTPGGTVDLRTGDLRPADQSEGITKLAAVAPAERAECPRWHRFLSETTGGDADLMRFLQQWAGYCLTGITSEHALVFGYGPGGNGKSVFVNTLTGVLGDYAVSAGMETFAASAHNSHPTDIARLHGARLVTASETEEGRAWAEARIKALTGGDRIAARFMRKDFFEFTPQFKLLIVGNHAPTLHHVDDAVRRRFCIVPFTRKPAEPDPTLEEKLREEWPGILRWAIEGCADWQECRLVRPAVVSAATDEYFSEQDLFGQFLDEECEVEVGNPWRSERSGDLFERWNSYARAAGEVPGSRKGFAARLTRRGLTLKKGTAGVRLVEGIRLKQRDRGGNDE